VRRGPERAHQAGQRPGARAVRLRYRFTGNRPLPLEVFGRGGYHENQTQVNLLG